jgi:hypothetical protein
MDVAPDQLEVAEARALLERSGYWMDDPRRVVPESVYDFSLEPQHRPWSVVGDSSWRTLSEALEEAKARAVRHSNAPS